MAFRCIGGGGVSAHERLFGRTEQVLIRKLFTSSLDMSKHHPDLIMCRKQPGIGMKTQALGKRSALLSLLRNIAVV
jgi:hypothetical protein